MVIYNIIVVNTFCFYFKMYCAYVITENVMLEAEKIKKGNIQFIENIPRNDVGKIVRSKLTKFL